MENPTEMKGAWRRRMSQMLLVRIMFPLLAKQAATASTRSLSRLVSAGGRWLRWCAGVFIALLLALTAPAQPATNLVQNGDFSLGNTGFASGYSYVPYDYSAYTNTAQVAEREYTVGPHVPPSYSDWAPFHTVSGGSSQMLVASGAASPSQSVWDQNIMASPTTTCLISFYLAEISTPGSQADIALSLDGAQIGEAVAPSVIDTWQQFSFRWSSGATTDVHMSLIDLNTAGNENGFAIDNIGFTAVSGIAPVLTCTTPAPITYGTALSTNQLDATANVPGTFSYTPPAGTVLSAGTNTLSTLFTPNDNANYITASASVSRVVQRAVPVLTWSTPAPITYGTALSSGQLNAAASVPGTAVYSPPAGTVLPAGTNTLSLVFTPTDATDYNGLAASVTLVVEAQGVTFVLGNYTNQPGDRVTASLSVSGFDQVLDFQFTLQWDPTVLSYVSLGNYGLNGLPAGNFGTILTNRGKVTVSWDDPTGLGTTVSNGTVIFTMSFVVVGSAGGRSSLALADAPTPREADTAAGFASLNFISVSGQVEVVSPAPGHSCSRCHHNPWQHLFRSERHSWPEVSTPVQDRLKSNDLVQFGQRQRRQLAEPRQHDCHHGEEGKVGRFGQNGVRAGQRKLERRGPTQQSGFPHGNPWLRAGDNQCQRPRLQHNLIRRATRVKIADLAPGVPWRSVFKSRFATMLAAEGAVAENACADRTGGRRAMAEW